MIIAIYGVSASGKDHLIGQLLSYLAERGYPAEHVRGSETLNTEAQRVFNAGFGALSEEDRAMLRTAFPKSLAKREQASFNVIVDGHYAFLSDSGDPYTVFTDADLEAYDAFFYLDTSPETVSQRIASERGERVDPEDVSKLKEYEIAGLSARLMERGEELHVIRNDGEPTLRYISEVICGRHSSAAIARNLVSKLGDLKGQGVVALVDCDKTLVLEDTTSVLIGNTGAGAAHLRDIYALDRYSNYQDYMARSWLAENAPVSEEAAKRVSDAVTLNAALVEDLARAKGIPVLAITAGNEAIWKRVISEHGIEATLLCSDDAMSKYVKYHVVKELQEAGKFVVAFGDSMMDSLMLEQADRSYIVSNKGHRASIASLLKRDSAIRQLGYSAYQYAGVHADPRACWVRCISDADERTKSDIEICRSRSGSCGRELRLAHYRLGETVGRIIERDFAGEALVAVVMMRSGLPFGQGIADVLDCPEFFFDGDAEKLRDSIVAGGYASCTLVLVDGVINTGVTLKRIADELAGLKMVAAANVVSSKCETDALLRIYAARVSENSYVGAHQWEQTGGKGPDTSDRLFATLT